MKKKRKHSLTFVMVPEANQAAREIRVPKLVFWAIPLAFLGLVAIIALQYHYHQLTEQYNKALSQQLAHQESEMRTVTADKDRQIESLNHQVIEVSHQAEQVQSKVQQLQALEDELRGIANPEEKDKGTTAAKEQPVKIASVSGNITPPAKTEQPEQQLQALSLHENGIGGQEHVLANADMLDVISDTGQSFTALSSELDALSVGLKEAGDEVKAYQHLQRITPSIWPTGYRNITSPYGARKDPFTGRWSFHSGIDIAGVYGSSVYAAAAGTVIRAGYSTSEGYTVIINHTNGIKTQYMHMSKYTVKQGDKVNKGDIIGKMGSTGRSTGTHLHYEVTVNGNTVDPKPYLKTARKAR